MGLDIIKNFILPFLANRKVFFIEIKSNLNNLIVINKNLSLSINRKVDKKIELLVVVT